MLLFEAIHRLISKDDINDEDVEVEVELVFNLSTIAYIDIILSFTCIYI